MRIFKIILSNEPRIIRADYDYDLKSSIYVCADGEDVARQAILTDYPAHDWQIEDVEEVSINENTSTVFGGRTWERDD